VRLSAGPARIEKLVTSGTFTLDGGTWEVENNVWLIGDDDEVIVIDAAHDAGAIKSVIGSRRVNAILCTHGHSDHIDAAPALAELTGAAIWLHPADAALWGMAHPVRQPDAELHAGQVLTIAGVDVEVLHTPGHSPGGVCLHAPAMGVLFSGDTLFAGGPGATGRSFSDFPTIIDSISHRLFSLPPDTVVHTGHGEDTTIGAEVPHLDEWVVRGY
jgi:glyoxylase-like metal-dependent hydrolase (beta-lactamase superfamily II)